MKPPNFTVVQFLFLTARAHKISYLAVLYPGTQVPVVWRKPGYLVK